MKYLSLIFIMIFFLLSCSSQKERKRHELFLKQMESKRRNLTKPEYRYYIKHMIGNKEAELIGLRQQTGDHNKMMDHHEVMSSSTGMDTYSFNKSSTGMKLKELDVRVKNVEKELYFLKSQVFRE